MRSFLVLALSLTLSSPIFAKAADISLRWMNQGDAQGQYESASHPNAVFVVEAYFQSCGDCNENAPNVNALGAAYAGNERVQILDIARDCRESDYRNWISRHSPNHPVLNDCAMEFLGPLNITEYPTTLIFDCDMNLLHRHEGFWDAEEVSQIHAVIDAQLSKICGDFQLR